MFSFPCQYLDEKKYVANKNYIKHLKREKLDFRLTSGFTYFLVNDHGVLCNVIETFKEDDL